MTTEHTIPFYFDPVCPWTWITYVWLREVAAERDFEIDLRSYSLRRSIRMDSLEAST